MLAEEDERLGDQLAQPEQLHPYGNDINQEENAQRLEAREKRVAAMQSDAPPCHDCGTIMVRNGTCYHCLNCGATSGCS